MPFEYHFKVQTITLYSIREIQIKKGTSPSTLLVTDLMWLEIQSSIPHKKVVKCISP